jgi:hypothetical protein
MTIGPEGSKGAEIVRTQLNRLQAMSWVDALAAQVKEHQMSSLSRTRRFVSWLSGSDRAEIPPGLGPDLVRTLALLDGAPPGIAESTIALLGFGARATLEAMTPPLITTDGGTPPLIMLTREGRRVIAACARANPTRSPGATDPGAWTSETHDERLAQALATLGYSDHEVADKLAELHTADC